MSAIRRLLAVAALAAGCGSASPAAPETSPTTTTVTPAPVLIGMHMTASPMDVSKITSISALGTMAPWGHTLPTDHVYFYHHVGPGPVEPVQVFAPAAGRIKFANNNRIDVDVDDEYSYWIGPVLLAPGIASGINVQAGTLLGTHSTGAPAFDFSVLRKTQRLNFINPARYSNETLWADGPMKYFEGPVKAQLAAKVLRTGSDLEGKIDYDVAGTLSGNWFAEDLAVSESARGGEEYYGSRKLAFARDVYQPHLRRVSIGGLGLSGLYAVNDDLCRSWDLLRYRSHPTRRYI